MGNIHKLWANREYPGQKGACTMSKVQTKQVTVTALFVVLGVLLPYVTGHAVGIPGTILLPMHIPVLLCAIFCGPRFGALCGFITPLLSSLLTGMPSLYPMMPILVVQLTTAGLVLGLLYGKWKMHPYPALILSMALGWLLYGLMASLLLLTGNQGMVAPSMLAALFQGIPGILLQLILIPAIAWAVKREGRGVPPQSIPEEKETEAREAALGLLRSQQASCVVIQNGAIVHHVDGRGVLPLLRLYQDAPETFKQAFVLDRIIGKAAAMILVLGGVKQVYGETMSVAAQQYLVKHGIDVEYESLVEMIANPKQDGMCPIEGAVLESDDPEEGLASIQQAMNKLMQSV